MTLTSEGVSMKVDGRPRVKREMAFGGCVRFDSSPNLASGPNSFSKVISLYDHSFQCARDCSFGHALLLTSISFSIWEEPGEWYRSSFVACHSSSCKHVTKQMISDKAECRSAMKIGIQ